MEAGLNRVGLEELHARSGLTLPLHYTEDKLLTLKCMFLIQERGLWGKR